MPEPKPLLLPGPRRLKTALALMLLALLAMAAHAPQALAHAAFLGAKPAPGQRVQRSPSRILLEFTEALNQHLSRIAITDLRSGHPINFRVAVAPSRDLVVRPTAPLPTAAYGVDWFSVSADDGHPLQGSFSFGVRTAALGGAHVVEQSPLARDGWLRISLRAAFFGALFFFAGGLFNGALLSRREGRGSWLLPHGEPHSLLSAGDEDPDRRAAFAWRRTVDAGWLAAAAAAAVAVAEAADAAGGLNLRGLDDYLLSNTAGLGRVATVLALAVAALVARRMPRPAAAFCAIALLAIAVSGHANSADPRAAAVLSDWIHLIAAAVWIGGIAQIALAWAHPAMRGSEQLRRSLMSGVLGRFGQVALPAFLLVMVSGLINALIELGHPAALWQSGYGRALAVKIGLVGLIALLSYAHALRLRPRLLAANPHPDLQLARRHWRLLGVEPALGAAVIAVAALLVAFPLPPRQLSGAAAAAAASAVALCQPSCPLPEAKPNQLAVADSAGSSIVAAWLRQDPAGLSGRLRLFDAQLKPPSETPTIQGAQLTPCGQGCWTFSLAGHPENIAVSVPEKDRLYTTRLPVRWRTGQRANALGRKLLVGAQQVMDRLRSVRQYERVTSGPGSLAVTSYRLQAPNRFAYRTKVGAEAITIGKRAWQRVGDRSSVGSARSWRPGRYAGGGPGFTTRTWFRWTPYAQAVRLLGVHRQQGRTIAEVALYDQGTPAWWRLSIDLGSMRARHGRLIAQGHYMRQRYYGFNRPLRIAPPPPAHGR